MQVTVDCKLRTVSVHAEVHKTLKRRAFGGYPIWCAEIICLLCEAHKQGCDAPAFSPLAGLVARLSFAPISQHPRAMDISFLDKIREQEVAVAAAHLSPPPSRLLEIGAGTGAQALVLAKRGFEVHAIDVAGSIYEDDKVFPVAIYDGTTIPFADASFDIVFSSHVLMHIAAADQFQQEILRVLKPGGQVVHILPTTSWRFWTCLMHYPARYAEHGGRVIKNFIGLISTKLADTRHPKPAAVSEPSPDARNTHQHGTRALGKLLLAFKPPSRLGERGNALMELYFFSEHCWRQLFKRNGQELMACLPSRLFYTGHMAFGAGIQLEVRSLLSHVLGSAGKVYVLRARKST